MIRLKVSGMTCGHCENAVKKALAAVPGVERVVDVSRERHEAIVEGSAEVAALVGAIKAEGYEAEAQP